MATREIIQNLSFRKTTGTFDPVEFSTFLQEQYLKKNRSGVSQKKTFAPSSIGGYKGVCPRYWYLAFNEHEFQDANDAQGIANMEVGTQGHARIEKLLEDSGIPADLETEMTYDDPPIRGYIDIMIEWKGEIVVGEFKTTNNEGFMYRRSTMKPSFQHLIQLLIYLKATQKKSGFLLYENKNSQELLVIPVEMNEKNEALLESVFEWLRAVYKNYQEGELPKRPFTRKNKICKGCPLFDWCWNKQPEGTIELPVMDVPKVY